MDEFATTLPVVWRWILGACAKIAAVGSAAAVIAKLGKPMREMRNQIKSINERIKTLETTHNADQASNNNRFKHDHDVTERLESTEHQLCKCMLALMDHMITGNSVERLKQTRDALNTFLIER